MANTKNSVLIYQIHVEKSSVEQSLPVLTNILVLGLHITLQPAETKLTAEDFGSVLRPPDDPASLGSKKNTVRFNACSKLKAQAFNMLDKHGVCFLSGQSHTGRRGRIHDSGGTRNQGYVFMASRPL